MYRRFDAVLIHNPPAIRILISVKISANPQTKFLKDKKDFKHELHERHECRHYNSCISCFSCSKFLVPNGSWPFPADRPQRRRAGTVHGHRLSGEEEQPRHRPIENRPLCRGGLLGAPLPPPAG